MLYLKQSTASQSVLIGPFVDDTDGKTAETGLTIANTDIRLSKNGGNMAAKNSGGGTHDEAGWYAITLDATDTNTVGRLQVSVDVAGALPAWDKFQVVEEAVYDAMYAASAAGPLQSTTAGRKLDVTANGEAGLDLNNTSGTLAAAQFAADFITGAKIAAGAIAKGDQLTGLNDLSAAQVNTEVDNAIVTYGLDHLVQTSVTGTDVADNSIIAKLVDDAATADWDGYDPTTASLEALNVDLDAIPTTAMRGTDNAALASVCTETRLSELDAATGGKMANVVDVLDALTKAAGAGDLTAILGDTSELQTDDVPGLIAALNDLSAAEVNAEVDTALATTTYAEPVAVPAATASIKDKINWLCALARNKGTQTSTTKTLRNDADGADIATAAVSDDGTVFTREEWS